MSVILPDWMETPVQAMEGNHERSVLEKSEKRHPDLEFALQPKSLQRTLLGMSRNSGSAFVSSPIGLANKISAI